MVGGTVIEIVKVQGPDKAELRVTITLKWVPGKRRFEGQFKSDAGVTGTLFYEWI